MARQGKTEARCKKKMAYHGKHNRHHRQFAFLHCVMMIYVCRPSPIERNQPPCVNCPAKHVLWNKFSFVPDHDLLGALLVVLVIMVPVVSVSSMLAISYVAKPVVIGVMVAAGAITMFKPFVDEHVCRIVVERGLDKLSRGETRWREERVRAFSLRHPARRWCCCCRKRLGGSESRVVGYQKKRPRDYRYRMLWTGIFLGCRALIWD